MRGEHKVGEQNVKTIPKGLVYGQIDTYDGADRTITGTSIFDPVLCELAYRWFCPPGGTVLDPFAGGSVRGIVAAKLGRHYFGVDLSERQVKANRAQAKKICGKPAPEWVPGDSAFVIDHAKAAKRGPFDFLFSCPPYADLEVYSDDPRDISNMAADKFEEAYDGIIRASCELLAPDRFACFVVGDVRDKKGMYRNLPGLTIRCFEASGLRLYNDAILVTAAGSLALRVRRQWESARKLGTTHQRVLVFIKGNPKTATQAVGPCEFGEIEDMAGLTNPIEPGAKLPVHIELTPKKQIKVKTWPKGSAPIDYGEKLTAESLSGEI